MAATVAAMERQLADAEALHAKGANGQGDPLTASQLHSVYLDTVSLKNAIAIAKARR